MTQPAQPARILVVDDDSSLGLFMIEILGDAHHEPWLVENAKDAMRRVQEETWDLVITDLRMPGMSGLELIGWIKSYDPRIAVLAITAYGSIETAVQSVRAGAADYITKPFEADALLLAVDKCRHERQLQMELARLRTEVDRRYGFDAVIARSVVMQEVLGLARRVADSPSTVLITGASGVGKEVLARAIHQSSRRRTKPFFAINCAAIPDNLLESELFGYKKGAFTGASSDKAGLLQQAHDGTLLLDEIGDLPLALQAKLLRVLQERKVFAVGATNGEPIDVRLIAASHRDLKSCIAQRTFRDDLYYRLSVIEIAIPRLCDRPDDIMPLADHFLASANQQLGRAVREFSGAAKKLLCAYSWPGNVRELENAVERAVNLCEHEAITPDDLPPALRRPSEQDFLDRAIEKQWTLAELEMAYARRVLAQTAGNKKRASTMLGIDRRTLHRWLGEQGAEEDEAPRTTWGAPWQK
ncbi:MAG TPA: sigma-54 dependent transcriptional regulator [Polyangiaceae bacterium]|nr:sigma-54 dependent transcriptional regulator [Polyangiaceae bacterium]